MNWILASKFKPWSSNQNVIARIAVYEKDGDITVPSEYFVIESWFDDITEVWMDAIGESPFPNHWTVTHFAQIPPIPIDKNNKLDRESE